MLTRKFLLILGSLVGLWLLAAVGAILLLHGVLSDLDEVSQIALTGGAETTRLVMTVNTVEGALLDQDSDQRLEPATIRVIGESMGQQIRELSASGLLPDEAAECLARIETTYEVLSAQLEALTSSERLDPSSPEARQAMASSMTLHDDLTELSRIMHRYTVRRQQDVTRKFRATALVLGITFLLLINGSILMFVRVALMILRPVGTLVDASRRLGREEFDSRVEIDQRGEFGELARAYNSLAQQLQANEQRKIETLHLVARTLNHELNNAISIIELQLKLVSRRAGADQAMARPLEQIHETLGRMSRTVEELRRVRRIVLTDYVSGVKMLDLQRSVAEHASVEEPLVTHPAETNS